MVGSAHARDPGVIWTATHGSAEFIPESPTVAEVVVDHNQRSLKGNVKERCLGPPRRTSEVGRQLAEFAGRMKCDEPPNVADPSIRAPGALSTYSR